jgi:hypothetical protein
MGAALSLRKCELEFVAMQGGQSEQWGDELMRLMLVIRDDDEWMEVKRCDCR